MSSRQQKRIEELEYSIETAETLLAFLKSHDRQISKKDLKKTLTMLNNDIVVRKAWLASAKSATGW